MAIQRGVTKQVRYKKETQYGVAPGATGAQLLRRVQSTLNLMKPGYGSNEQRTDQQRAMYRHGMHNVTGNLSGELSSGTYKDFMTAALRATAPTIGVSTTATTISTASGTPNVFTRSGGSFITDGFKIGDIVMPSGFSAPMTTVNNKLFRIVALTATAMTVTPILNGTTIAWGTMAAGPSVTIAVAGKKIITPPSSQADDSFWIEEWFPDAPSSEQFTGVKINTMAFNFPPTGAPQVSFGVSGRTMEKAATAYFTSPTAITGTDVLTSALGWMRVGNANPDEVTLTSLQINLNNDISTENVALTQYKPGDFPGIQVVNGQFTVLFNDVRYRDMLFDETITNLHAGVITSSTTTTEFTSIYLPKIVIADRSKNDQPKALTETITFEAMVNVAGGAGTTSDYTTMTLQDGNF